MAFGTVKVDQITTSTQTITVDNLATTASLGSTYLTQSSAASVYLTQSAAGTTYAPLASPAFTSDIELSAQAPLKFMDADSSNYVAFRAPATVGSNVTWTLPATDAAGTLTSDGSGTLSWAAASGGGGASLGLALALG